MHRHERSRILLLALHSTGIRRMRMYNMLISTVLMIALAFGSCGKLAMARGASDSPTTAFKKYPNNLEEASVTSSERPCTDIWDAAAEGTASYPIHANVEYEFREGVSSEEHVPLDASNRKESGEFELISAAQAPSVNSQDTFLTTQQKGRLRIRNQYRQLAKELEQKGKFDEATQTVEKMLSIEREVFGDLHDDVVDTLKNLASLYQKMESFPNAVKTLQDVLSIQSRRYPPKDHRKIDAALELAWVEQLSKLDKSDGQRLSQARSISAEAAQLYYLRKFKEGISAETQALEIRKQVLGENHRIFGQSLHLLAELHLAMNNFSQAEILYLQVLELETALVGKAHPEVALKLRNLGRLYLAKSDYPKAEAYFRQADDIWKSVYGENRNFNNSALIGLSQVYNAMKDRKKAEAVNSVLLSLFNRSLDGQSPDSKIPRVIAQLGTANRFYCMTISPDGRKLVTADMSGLITLWDIASDRELRRYIGNNGPVSSVRISADGRLLLVGTPFVGGWIWELETGKLVKKINIDLIPAETFELSSNNKWVVALTGQPEKCIVVYDLVSSTEAWRSNPKLAISKLIGMSTEGKRVLAGCSDQSIHAWDIATGEEIFQVRGFSNSGSAVISADGKKLLYAHEDKSIRQVDTETGHEERRLEGHSEIANNCLITSDGRWAISSSSDKSVRLWDLHSGREVRRLLGLTKVVDRLSVSKNGQWIITCSEEKIVRLWDLASGREIRQFNGLTDPAYEIVFTPDNRFVLARCAGRALFKWTLDGEQSDSRFQGDADPISSVSISADCRWLATGSYGGSVSLWDLARGKKILLLEGKKDSIRECMVALSADGRWLVSSTIGDPSARLWEVATNKEVAIFSGSTNGIRSLAIMGDGRQILLGLMEGNAILWDRTLGKEVHRFPGSARQQWKEENWETSVAISSNGKLVATGEVTNDGRVIVVWDVATFQEIRRFQATSIAFSSDGQRAATIQTATNGKSEAFTSSNTVALWDISTGKMVGSRELPCLGLFSVNISGDGKVVSVGSSETFAALWDVDSNRIRFLEKHLNFVQYVALSANRRIVATISRMGVPRLWEAVSGKELCSLVSFSNGDWAVVDPAGRYDAIKGGDVEGLHWVIANEPIALKQLKERYYDPGLLSKHLGHNSEPLRDVVAFQDIDLYPEVKLVQKDTSKSQLDLSLTNRGGGIGRVVVLVNGKELTDDARASGIDPDAIKLDIKLDLTNNPRLIPGNKNIVEVLAFNAEGYLSSRGIVREIQGPGNANVEKPNVYAIVVGISDYHGGKLNLRYAAKDAEDFATAFRLAASRFFGAERVYLTVLTTAAGSKRPTRAALDQALDVLKSSKPGDVIVIYLAGHGITYGGTNGDWHFLTADAQSTELADPEVRRQFSLSSLELTDLLKAAPALKQVLILDTCQSGRVVEKISEKRDVPGSQIRAMERVKDRTGIHVLAGCAADSVSYEASRYGQGILSYSLLLGMRGAKLREGEYVDVKELFEFAADKVPELAREIGGIQRPIVASPKGASFDIGRLTAEDRAKVPLQTVKPVVIRCSFQEEKRVRDTLNLAKRVNDRLRDSSSTPRGAKLVFVDAEEFPGGIQAAGRYKIADGRVKVSVTLFDGEKEISQFTLEGEEEKPDEMAAKITGEIEKYFRGG